MPRIEDDVKAAQDLPDGLRPFTHLGLDPQMRPEDKEAKADCPLCGKEGKLSIRVDTTEWHCWSCAARGNALSFVRQLWEASDQVTPADRLATLASSRRLLGVEALTMWGAARSVLTGEWLIPGHSVDGRIDQLYRWARLPKRLPDGRTAWTNRLIPTPGLHGPGESHGLHGLDAFDPQRLCVAICEGAWDGMALWEVTDSLPDAQWSVTATPGCDVFRDTWAPLFTSKRVFLLFDNDHPRWNSQQQRFVDPAAVVGLQRAAALLSGSDSPPAEILCLWWGGKEAYHDPVLPDGHDVQDFLSAGKTLADRQALFSSLLERCRPVPREWLKTKGSVKQGKMVLDPLACSSWHAVLDGWERALRMRTDLSDVLAVMLAVCLSTEQLGDQLFLQVVGDAGSAKTRFCEGLLVSRGCHLLEHLTGFHSGFKGKGEDSGKDFSLISRVNRKTLVTPEGDVLFSLPNFDQVMAQQRRIFDGSSGATYKNSDEDRRYVGLRTPWIIAGTPAMLDKDQSRLGDRFLRIHIDHPEEDERQHILRVVGFSALRSVRQRSNGVAEGQVEQLIGTAYRLTGGYVDWLRANSDRLLEAVQADDEALVARCSMLAEWAAVMRSRPHPDPRKEAEVTVEMPTRLTHQLVRLALCLAATLNKTEVDAEVMRIVRKVAVDTGRGRSAELINALAVDGWDGSTAPMLAVRLGKTEPATRRLLGFLAQAGAVEQFRRRVGMGTATGWRLTTKMLETFVEVHRAEDR